MKQAKALIIVESPTKERTISAMVGKNFMVKSCMGHIRDLPRSTLGVDPKKDFAVHYVVLQGKAPLVNAIKAMAKEASKIYLATDFDREGEAIAWHLLELIRAKPEAVARITFHEITPRAIGEAIKNPRQIDMNLVEAQQARRIIDRLVGYSISPLLWRKVQRRLSAGRVQSVALKFIVEREKEILAFRPQEYWSVQARLAKKDAAVKDHVKDSELLALLVREGERKIERLDIGSKDAVDKIVAGLQGASFRVEEVKETQAIRMPLPPLTTADLQQSSHRACGFSPAKTMMLAQSLYEGKSLPGGTMGLITYMRTDSVHIAPEARAEALSYIAKNFGAAYAGKDTHKRFLKKKKFAQEAHEAIRPTSAERTPESLAHALNPDEIKVYDIIWRRFLQSQMAEAKLAVTSINIAAANCGFRTSGTVVLFDGFRRLDLRQDREGSEEEGRRLPRLVRGEELKFLEFLTQQHSTEPPPRFNPASLIKTMEANGVGRPSTYAPTIGTLIARNYVTLEKKVFIPTEIAVKVYERLSEHFSKIMDVGFTAKMESLLDEIAEGKAQSKKVLHDFWKAFEVDLKKAEKEMVAQIVEPQETQEKCEKCGLPMLLRESRFGKYLSCKNFPTCTFKIGLTASGQKKVVKATEIPCEKCGTFLVERTGRRGPFLACPKFPKCRFTKSLPKPEAAPGSSPPQAPPEPGPAAPPA